MAEGKQFSALEKDQEAFANTQNKCLNGAGRELQRLGADLLYMSTEHVFYFQENFIYKEN